MEFLDTQVPLGVDRQYFRSWSCRHQFVCALHAVLEFPIVDRAIVILIESKVFGVVAEGLRGLCICRRGGA